MPLLLQSFADLEAPNCYLVLAGGGNSQAIQEWIQKNQMQDQVLLVGWVSDEQLGEFYKKAHCFIYPSFYEGFGLQLTEAMNYGCAILSSNQASLPEVLGDTKKGLFSPDSPQQLTQLMQKTLQDPEFLKELRQWSTQRSQFFTWSKTAKETLAVYERLQMSKEATTNHTV